MPVQEFECQIARGQIGRYLNGEGLSSEGLRHLGVHVAECEECKTFLDHRKATLQGMLGEAPMPTHQSAQAVVGINPSEALIAQIRARSGEVEPESVPAPVVAKAKPIITKPIIYCGGLAIVLVAMTYLSRNPTGFLGRNAAQAVAANSPSKAEVAPPVADKSSETKAALPVQAKPENPAPEKPTPETKPTATTETEAISTAAKTETPPAAGIDPAGTKPHSPISIDPKPVNKPAGKLVPKAKPVNKHPRKPWHKRGGPFHLKAGTGAIHVYKN